MSEDHPDPTEPDPTAPDPGDLPADAEAKPDQESEYVADGLDLARALTRSTAHGAVTPKARRTRKPSTRRRRGAGSGSGSHPDDRDPQLLGDAVGRLVASGGWEVDLRVQGVFGRWTELVGDEVAAHVTPEQLEDGKLTVRTDSTAWATQLRLLAPTLVRRLNEQLGHGTITVIDILGPHGPTWKKGPRSVRDGRGPRDTYG